MPVLQTSRTALVALLSTAATGAGECPPRAFDYGPALPDAEIVQIVLDHYGPGDPIVPTPADYERAAIDVGLIYDFVPSFLNGHSLPPEPDAIAIQTNLPDDPDLLCLNEYYSASTGVLFRDWWWVEFPQQVNIEAMAAIYGELAAVTDVGNLNAGGCAGACCISFWRFTPLADGDWDWDVHSSVPLPQHSACSVSDWDLRVSSQGAVSLSPDVNDDDIVDGADLGLLLLSWGTCPRGSDGEDCPADLDWSGSVDGSDLGALLLEWD